MSAFLSLRRALTPTLALKFALLAGLALLGEPARAADPTVMVPVMVDTNLNLGVGYVNFFQQNATPLNLAIAGANTNLSGLALASGTATLSNGTNLVSSVWAWTTNRFTLGYRGLDGTVSPVMWKSATNGVSFTIYSASATDTNQVDWVITKP